MNLAVQFKGTPSLFRVNMGAETAVGKANFDLALQPYRDGLRSIDGNVAARNLRLGELLGRTDLFGDASLSARIDGVIGRRYADAQVDGTVDRLTFNDYTYDTLHLDGRLFNKRFDGRISARDPHLNFDFSGLLDFNEQVPRYDFCYPCIKPIWRSFASIAAIPFRSLLRGLWHGEAGVRWMI